MKSFGTKPWLLPQPALIIGTYDENGRPNAKAQRDSSRPYGSRHSQRRKTVARKTSKQNIWQNSEVRETPKQNICKIPKFGKRQNITNVKPQSSENAKTKHL